MGPEQRGQTALVDCGQQPGPRLISQDVLEHEGGHVHESRLQDPQAHAVISTSSRRLVAISPELP